MNSNIKPEKNIQRWDWKSWLWVLLCSIGIFSTVPVARSIQKFVYDTVGREYFTYAVLFVIAVGFAMLLLFFIFQLRVKSISQYIWLFICAGLYVYFTIQLKKYPEEAIHLLEYGLISYFLFRALSHKIQDWTIYITAALFALFIGTIDEFIQWIMPDRYFGFKDVEINALASGIFLIAVWKGIKPKIICKPIKKISVKMLVGIITVDLMFLGLCLSNTPSSVKSYTNVFNSLSWLRSEEPMTEFGYKHNDPEIGTFYSRLTLTELKEIDLNKGEAYEKILPNEINSEETYKELIKIYTPYTNPFLYEFLVHIIRRNDKFEEFTKTNNPDGKIEKSHIAYREHLIIEKYFKNTLKHSELGWSDQKIKDLQKTASLWKEDYTSKVDKIITSFTLKTGQAVILITLIIVWVGGEFWKRRIDN